MTYISFADAHARAPRGALAETLRQRPSPSGTPPSLSLCRSVSDVETYGYLLIDEYEVARLLPVVVRP